MVWTPMEGDLHHLHQKPMLQKYQYHLLSLGVEYYVIEIAI